MTSADPETSQIFDLNDVPRILAKRNFSIRNPCGSRPPLVRAKSFSLCPVHLQNRDYWLQASQWCGCLPSLICLIYTSCSSVQTFAVSLPSVLGSPQTTLWLTNRLIIIRQLADKGLLSCEIILAKQNCFAFHRMNPLDLSHFSVKFLKINLHI